MAWYRVFNRIKCFWTAARWRSKCWAKLADVCTQYVRWRVKVRIVCIPKRQTENEVDRSYGICTIRRQLQHLNWALGQGLDYLGIGIRFQEDYIFSPPHSILSASGANHGHRFHFPVVKGGRSMKHNAHQHLAAKLSIRGATPRHSLTWHHVVVFP